MVRTKADGAVRVAAGGKAPKKTASRPVSVASPSDKGGKDHLPGNRACPRETPAWQKSITSFFDKNATSSKSRDDDESSSSNSKNNSKLEKNNTDADKSSTNVDDDDNVEMEEGNSSVLESSKVDESESMETDG